MITYIIIALTVLVSIFCFNSHSLFDALSMNPYRVIHRGEWYRVLTHGFVHGDYMHLVINMLVLYSFGMYLEKYLLFLQKGGLAGSGVVNYLVLYFGGMVTATIYDLVKRRDNPYFSSIGASGAVSAVIFAYIFFDPWGKIYLFGLLPIPGILFGVLFLAYSQCGARRGKDHVNHFAHFYGAVFGFIYPILMNPRFVLDFIDKFKF